MKTSSFSLLALFTGCSDIKVFFRKLQGKMGKSSQIKPSAQRSEAILPEGGEEISVEPAFNTRCISDHDGRQGVFHWGRFDPEKRLPDAIPDQFERKLNQYQFFGQNVSIR